MSRIFGARQFLGLRDAKFYARIARRSTLPVMTYLQQRLCEAGSGG